MKLNLRRPDSPVPVTHGGAQGARITPMQMLRRSVMACMLWEDNFYEDGQSIADRISAGVKDSSPRDVAGLAVEVRTKGKIRHTPLLLIIEMLKHPEHRKFVRQTISQVVQRPDELGELMMIFRKQNPSKKTFPHALLDGIADCFHKFDEYQLQKYEGNNATFALRDVLRLAHPKPRTTAHSELWKKLSEGKLESAETWNQQLSAGKNKVSVYTSLIQSGKLPAMATLKNIRKMAQVGVGEPLIREAIGKMSTKWILPFRYLVAAEHAPDFKDAIEAKMFESLGREKLDGKTIIVVDVSGSMYGAPVTNYSEMDRAKAACSLALLAREKCERPRIYATAGSDGLRLHKTALVEEAADMRGFKLGEYIHKLSRPMGGGGIFLNQCLRAIQEYENTNNPGPVKRVIVITDEQDCANRPEDIPKNAPLLGAYNYMLNVANCKTGIGYGAWIHIDGWSEASLEYMIECETQDAVFGHTMEETIVKPKSNEMC